MKNPVTPLNNWILSKICHFLLTREGCTVEEVEYTQKGAKASVQDVFGFRYEIEIKLTGRAQTNDDRRASNPTPQQLRG